MNTIRLMLAAILATIFGSSALCVKNGKGIST